MASPAPIIPAQTPAIAPGNAPAAAEGDSAASFETVLAAALGIPALAKAKPPMVVLASADVDKLDSKPADIAESTDLPAQVLDIAASAQAAVPAPLALPVAPASTPAVDVDALTGAKTNLREPAVAPTATAAARRDTVAPAVPPPIAALSVPEAATQDPAKIAAPAPAAGRPAADPAPVASAAADPLPKADSAPTPNLEASSAISVAPLTSERVEGNARPSVQPARLEVAAPVGSREFGAEVGSRLVWMASNHHQVAELRLDPPQLGPVEVRLSIANDQASLSFASPHAAVRDAIQASLPRLQDLLQGLGISLGNVSVGAEGFAQGNPDHAALAHGWAQSEPAQPGLAYPLHEAGRAGLLPIRTGLGMIDVYA